MKPLPVIDFVRNIRASPRALAGLLGGVLLIVSATGAYFAARSTPGDEPQPSLIAQRPFDFRPYATPRALPDITFEDEKGKALTLAHFRGKVVLLNIWATWCTPCRKEMPALDRLQQRLGGPDFEVVALSIDHEGVPVVKRFFKETDVKSLAIYVDKTIRAGFDLGVVGVPTTLLIDRSGQEIGRVAGPAEWDSPEVVETIRRYLKPAA